MKNTTIDKKPVRKAVIAAAGFGTRFLPQTKAMPKEMLPIVDKPIIQYVVEALVDAGIEDIIIVTGYHKRSIEDHFDEISEALKINLQSGDKAKLLSKTNHISDMANFIYVRQKGPYGNATPIVNCAHLLEGEPFIYTYADEIITARPNHFKQLISLYDDLGSSILPCIKVDDPKAFDRYGILGGEELKPGLIEMSNIIEKPGKKNAPSNLASVGGYLLTPEIFDYLDVDTVGKNEEFTIQPAMRRMIDDGIKLYGCEVKNAKYYDTGNKLEYIKTVIDFSLKHPDMQSELQNFLASKLSKIDR